MDVETEVAFAVEIANEYDSEDDNTEVDVAEVADTEVEVEIARYYHGEKTFNVENPLHTHSIPIANLVVLEVEGRPVLHPERKLVCETCEKVLDYIKLSGAILVLLGFWGGFFMFMIWIYKPNIFGTQNNDNIR